MTPDMSESHEFDYPPPHADPEHPGKPDDWGLPDPDEEDDG